MRLFTTLALFALLIAPVSAQQTYTGNTGTGFGGTMGAGSITLNDDGTSVTVTFNTGAAFNDVGVLYIDSKTGGITSTSGLNDTGDNARRAISGTDGSNRSTVNFATGFTPDYALAMESGYFGLFEIASSGSHTFVSGAPPSVSGSEYTSSFPLSDIGVATGNAFDFVGTYLNGGNAFRSNEAVAPSDAPGGSSNIGYGTLNFSAAAQYPSGVLPVELASFTGAADGSRAVLNWVTASETNNEGFDVQMRSNGDFQTVDFVRGAGTTLEAQRYAFTTPTLAPGSYAFRLRQVDLDGAAEFSPVVELAIGLEGAFALALEGPNPFAGQTALGLSVAKSQNVTAGLYDLLGRRVATLLSGTVEGAATLSVDAAGLPSGLYVVRIQGETFRTSRTLTVAR